MIHHLNYYFVYVCIALPTTPPNPCNPSPCGANAVCKERNGAGSCSCLPEYIGDPYIGCRPECVLNSECPYNKACINNKCIDPCTGICGTNAECHVINHAPSCICINGYTGNPLVACHLQPKPSRKQFFLFSFPYCITCSLSHAYICTVKSPGVNGATKRLLIEKRNKISRFIRFLRFIKNNFLINL